MKKIYLSVALLSGILSTQLKAQIIPTTLKAVKATGGTGLHNNKIYWINWDLDNNNAGGDNLKRTILNPLNGIYESPAGFKYTISLATIEGDIVSASVTDYFLNSFPVGYTGFTPASNIIAIKQNPSGSVAKFQLTVTVTEPGSIIPRTPKGLVIAGSESLSGIAEYYTLKMDNLSTGKVKAIDKYIYNNNWNNYNVELQVSNLGKTIKATQASGSNGDGRGDVMLLAEDVNTIDIELKGGGGQHIALGIIEDIDYSDAPNSYGIAFHEIESKFSTTTLSYNTNPDVVTKHQLNKTSNTVDINSSTGQLSKPEKPSLYLGNDVDADIYPTSFPAAGADPKTDDTTGINDDDAFVDSPVQVNFDLPTQFVNVKVNNTTGSTANLSIWVDKNRNGQFDSNEVIRKDVPSNPNPQTIAVDLKSLAIPKGSRYYTRVRLTSKNNIGPTGFAPDGEVEDHLINVYYDPYNIYGVVYKDKNAGTPDGTPFAGVTAQLYNEQGTLLQTSATNSAGVYFFEGLPEDIYKVKVLNPAGNYLFVSSTDDTPTDGETIVNLTNNRFDVDFGVFDPVCYKDATITPTGGKPVTYGITALNRAGDQSNWPMARKGAWTALESKNTGFVINRVAANTTADGGQIPSITPAVKGMIVYDTTNHCLKIYNGTQWSCFDTIACPN